METTRTLGRSGIEVSALGFGCWAIGGEWQDTDGQPLGWGKVDDDESVRAIRRALDLGVTFFDTADVYGTGHSERLLGRALGKPRAGVFAEGPHCTAVQHRLNILQDAPELLAVCAESDLAGISRSPLAMGLL